MKITSLIQEWKWPVFALFAILLLALFLRVQSLNLIPVFADEAIYVRWAQVMRAETTLRFLPLSDGKQPLFMWTVMPFLKIFSDPLIAGRMVSVLTGLGTVVGIFALSFIFFKSKKAALVGALLYALSPFAVFFDRMALVDSMLAFFGVWTLVLSVLTIKYLRLDLAFITGATLGAALLTKSPAIFFVLLMPFTLVLTNLKNKLYKLQFIKAVVLFVVVVVIGYAIYNVLRLGPNFHLVNSRNYDYVFPYSHILESPWSPFIGHLKRAVSWFWSMGPGAFIFLTLLGAAMNFKQHKKEILVLLLAGLAPIIVQSEFAKVFTSRYIFFTLPPLFVLGGAAFIDLKKPVYKYTIALLALVFVIQTLFFYITFFNSPASANWPEKEGYLANWTAGTGIREVAEIIKSERNRNPDKKIVVGTEGYFGTLPDGLQIYLEKEPNITVIGVGLGISEIPESLLQSIEAGNKTYLVANSSRLNFSDDFSKYGLTVVASYEKAARDPGTHDFVQSGEHDTFYLFELK